MVSDFLDRWPPDRRRQLVDATNELVALMRAHDRPIIWVRQEFEPDLSDAFTEMRDQGIAVTIKGTPGCQIVPDLRVTAAERVVVKKRYSAFFGTQLETMLKERGCGEVVVAGVNTHACVRMTAIDAYQRDLRVIIATDCVDSRDVEHHSISLRYLGEHIGQLATNAELRVALTQA